MSPPEVHLWVVLRGKAQDGLRFRRQHPMGPYILDFYCAAAALAVEVDGDHHGIGDQPAHDARRDLWLAERGVKTLRVAARDIRDNLDGVVEAVIFAAREKRPAPPPPGPPVFAGHGASARRRPPRRSSRTAAEATKALHH